MPFTHRHIDLPVIQEIDRVVEKPSGIGPSMDKGGRFMFEEIEIETGAHQLLRIGLTEGPAPCPIPDRGRGSYAQIVEVRMAAV